MVKRARLDPKSGAAFEEAEVDAAGAAAAELLEAARIAAMAAAVTAGVMAVARLVLAPVLPLSWPLSNSSLLRSFLAILRWYS